MKVLEKHDLEELSARSANIELPSRMSLYKHTGDDLVIIIINRIQYLASVKDLKSVFKSRL